MNHLAQFKLKAISCGFAALGLTACGGTGQDVGQVTSAAPQHVSGVAVDGYLARATVFLDYDNNGTRNPWEPYAYTDDQGYFSYNPITDTDYCANASLKTFYCLQSSNDRKDVVIRVDGGYDVMTGEPFVGQLSRRVDVVAGKSVDALVSPFTSLLTDITSNEAKQTLLAAVGITEADLDVDYFNDSGSGETNTTLLNTAIKLHKINNVMADLVEDRYQEVLDGAGMPNDLSASVYRQFATQLLASNSTLDEAVNDAAFVKRVILATDQEAKNLAERRDLVVPADITPTKNTEIAETVKNLSDVVNTLLTEERAVDRETINGLLRVVETVMIKHTQDDDAQGAKNAVEFINNPNNDSDVRALVNALSQNDADISSLVRNNFTNTKFSEGNNANDHARLPDGATSFSSLAGKQLRVSDMDMGFGPNNLEDSEVEVYFVGTPGATSGTLVACAKHIEDATSDGTLGENSIRGERVEGQWSLLNPKEGENSSYSVILTLKFLGATYQAIMKSAGQSMANGAMMETIRFDYAGEIRSWHSEQGLQPQTSIPANNKACELRLPSRIGLKN